MNIAFLLIPEKGHVNPYIGPAQVLASQGHDVIIAAPGDISGQLAQAGLRFSSDLIAPLDRPTHGEALVRLIQDAPRLANWIEQLLLSNIEPQVEAIRHWLRVNNITIVVIDPLYYPAAIAAHLEVLPWASVSNSLNPLILPELDSALLQTVRHLAPRRAALFAENGFPNPQFSGCDVLSPHLTVAFTTEALCGHVPGVHLVGPSAPIKRRGDEVPLQEIPADRPLVYASFGSQIYHWPEIFRKIVAAAEPLEVQLALSTGDLPWPDPPPYCHLYRYAPQLSLLERASVFITHGGANSFMEAISAGVPMLLSPMCNDQFHQAFFLKQTHAGSVLDLIHATVPEITGALQTLLGDGPHRTAMRNLSQSYRQHDGAVNAANLIAALGK